MNESKRHSPLLNDVGRGAAFPKAGEPERAEGGGAETASCPEGHAGLSGLSDSLPETQGQVETFTNEGLHSDSSQELKACSQQREEPQGPRGRRQAAQPGPDTELRALRGALLAALPLLLLHEEAEHLQRVPNAQGGCQKKFQNAPAAWTARKRKVF